MDKISDTVRERITDIKPFGFDDIVEFEKQTCLTSVDIVNYLKGFYGYGWHISDLKIYDKPREIYEFGRGCDAENIGEIHCRDCKKLVSFDDCCEVVFKPLNRPPQSWCYVEDVG